MTLSTSAGRSADLEHEPHAPFYGEGAMIAPSCIPALYVMTHILQEIGRAIALAEQAERQRVRAGRTPADVPDEPADCEEETGHLEADEIAALAEARKPLRLARSSQRRAQDGFDAWLASGGDRDAEGQKFLSDARMALAKAFVVYDPQNKESHRDAHVVVAAAVRDGRARGLAANWGAR